MDSDHQVRIKNFYVTGFRSCHDTSVSLNPQLSALIGINGSGKTNLLNALMLIRKVHSFRNYPYSQKNEPGKGQECTLAVDFMVSEKLVNYRASINYTTNQRNQEEVIGTEEKWNLREINGKDEWISFPSYLIRPEGKEAIGGLAQYFMIRSIQLNEGQRVSRAEFDQYANLSSEIHSSLGPVSYFLSRISYYSASKYTNPSECPPYFYLEDESHPPPTYRGQGREPHVRFLYDLYRFYDKNPQGYQEFESIAGRKGLGLIDKVTFYPVRVPVSEVEVRAGGRIVKKKIKREIVVPHFIVHGTKLSPGQLSEGTFKTLAILLYLITDASELLLLEEPEVCIHHGLLSSLVELIKTHSVQKQIVITTHSDFVLDQLTPESVFLVKNTPKCGTKVERLPESMSARNYLALKEYLGSTGNLGEYWRDAGFE